jgi:hypothetical protein
VVVDDVKGRFLNGELGLRALREAERVEHSEARTYSESAPPGFWMFI